MGIAFTHAAFMMKQKRINNICFNDVLTLGHQTLYIQKQSLETICRKYGLSVDLSSFRYRDYADSFLKTFLNAKNVQSIDVSPHEDADIIHDMNYPVDCALHGKYDVVIDGGSLEHIFNFPCTIKNCMSLVKEGGSIFIFTVCNNHSGHGFYQFSPELFFRTFSKEYGFDTKAVILEKHHYPGLELSLSTKCYSVSDPYLLKKRVGLVSKCPVAMLIHAVKIENKESAKFPIQSDYSIQHDSYHAGLAVNQNRLKEKIRVVLNNLPVFMKNYIVGNFQLYRYCFLNKQSYKRWYPFD